MSSEKVRHEKITFKMLKSLLFSEIPRSIVIV